MGVCVPNFRSVSLLVWPGDVTHINTYIHKHPNILVNLRISSAGCSPHADFEKDTVISVFFSFRKNEKFE